jgi:antirestriction protein ArdC
LGRRSTDFLRRALAGNGGTAAIYVDFLEKSHPKQNADKSRLDRGLKNRFDSRDYAAEELVAELCSTFLAAEFGINKEVRHASEIAHWIELLKHDDRAFFTAASKAKSGRLFAGPRPGRIPSGARSV